MRINQLIMESDTTCSECGGPAFTDLILAEKKDACYYKVKASAKVWPSAYASGRLVQCRKKGAGNYGNKSEGVAEDMNVFEDDQVRPQGRILKSLRDMAIASPTSTFQNFRQAGKESIITDAIMAAKVLKRYYQQKGNQTAVQFLYNLENELDDFRRGYNSSTDNLDLSDLSRGTLGKMQFQTNEGVAEEYNPEYDDEAGMADNNLETLERAVEGIDDLIQSGDNLPEWCQEKIAVAKSMLVAVWDYMESEEDSDEVDPEIDAMFEAMDQLAEEMAVKHGLDVDTVWENFESMDDNMLYETAAWRRKEGKSKKGGLNAKGVASYRRENPGSKLQMAVTTKPSKLKKGSKAAKRRKSFCARMGGVKGPMKKPNGKPTRKALALRKWNC